MFELDKFKQTIIQRVKILKYEKKYIQDTYLSQMLSTNDKRDFALNQQSKVNHKR